MRKPINPKETAIKAAGGTLIAALAYFGLDEAKHAFSGDAYYLRLARDIVEIGKDLTFPILLNKFLGDAAQNSNYDGTTGRPVGHLDSKAVVDVVRGTSVGLGAMLLLGDIANSDLLMKLSVETSEKAGSFYEALKPYLFWGAGLVSGFRDYFSFSKK